MRAVNTRTKPRTGETREREIDSDISISSDDQKKKYTSERPGERKAYMEQGATATVRRRGAQTEESRHTQYGEAGGEEGEE